MNEPINILSFFIKNVSLLLTDIISGPDYDK